MPPKSRPTARPALVKAHSQRHIAVVGAGIAGIACARTLMQAGHRVSVFEKSRGTGGRMATRRTEFGSFDHGTQYFTVRDARFAKALETAQGLVRPWSATPCAYWTAPAVWWRRHCRPKSRIGSPHPA